MTVAVRSMVINPHKVVLVAQLVYIIDQIPPDYGLRIFFTERRKMSNKRGKPKYQKMAAGNILAGSH
jgi:hypothetical protein